MDGDPIGWTVLLVIILLVLCGDSRDVLGFEEAMNAYLQKLKTSTKAWIAFFLFNISLTQVEQARDFLLPKLVHHPRVSGVALSLFGLAILLHRPQVQKFLKREPDGDPTIPAEVGAKIGDVEVVTKENA